MCEFCTSHGEGQKWYLNLKNYSDELLSDPERLSMIRNFYGETIEKGGEAIARMEILDKKNHRLLQRIRDSYIKEMKSVHYGQVLPMEEAESILMRCSSVVRLPCGCRWKFRKEERRVCFGISRGESEWFTQLDTGYFGEPDVSLFDHIDPSSAVEMIRRLDAEGMVHSVWTFQTPFIGAICNCDMQSCLAMRSTVGLGMPLMFRAEYVARIDFEKCAACGECSKVCRFGAIVAGTTGSKPQINNTACYGCGICRTVCPSDAVGLVGRYGEDTGEGL